MKFCVVACVGFCLSSTLRAGTVAHYRFDTGPDGATVSTLANGVIDSSGNGLHATASSSLTYSSDVAAGQSNYSLNAGGNVSYVSRGDTGAGDPLRLGNDFTLEVFIKADAPYTGSTSAGPIGSSPWDVIVTKKNKQIGQWGSGYGLDYSLVDGNPAIRAEIGFASDTGQAIFSSPLSSGWHHVAMVVDYDNVNPDSFSLYVDGTLSNSPTLGNFAPIDYGTQDFMIGAGNFGGFGEFSRNFGGKIDEVRISDVALTPSQFLNAVAVPEIKTAVALLPLMGWTLRRRMSDAMA